MRIQRKYKKIKHDLEKIENIVTDIRNGAINIITQEIERICIKNNLYIIRNYDIIVYDKNTHKELCDLEIDELVNWFNNQFKSLFLLEKDINVS